MTFPPLSRAFTVFLLSAATLQAQTSADAATPDPQRMEQLQSCARGFRELVPYIQDLNADVASLEKARAALEIRRNGLRNTNNGMENGAYMRGAVEYSQAAAQVRELERIVSAKGPAVKARAATYDDACKTLATTAVEREALCVHFSNKSFCESRGW
jgi:TolA-binding protein